MDEQHSTTQATKHRIRDSIIFAVILFAIAVAFLWQNYRISALQDQIGAHAATVYANTNSMNTRIDKLQSVLHRNGYTITPDELAVYGFDESTGKTIIVDYVPISLDWPVEERLERLAGLLSYRKFNGLPIQIKAIKNVDNKRIAVVDLQNKQYSSCSWEANYFQGSTGGTHTSITLAQTLLQPDYEGEWIDGLEFLYQGKPIGEWDHISLSGTLLRKKKPE